MIHVDFESILVPEDNGKQTPNASYTKKYQKHIACSYGFKLNEKDIKQSRNFFKILFCCYRFKIFTRIYDYKILHFLISQDF